MTRAQSSEASPRDSVRQGSRYAPIAELGRGGMATALLSVMRGPRGFNKLMVVKRLRPALAAEPEFLKMFLDEARLAARIDHPNVVHTSEVGVDGQDCFIAMEFIDGQSLEHVVRRAKKSAAADASFEAVEAAPGMPLRLGLHVVTLVLDALHFAHELKDFDGTPLNVVHRDVSPHNVMITYEGHVKLLDFGIAKAADSTAETRTGVIKGKCGYMAPEQFGGGEVDRRADVFAVGVMLWQAITGRKMWARMTDVDIFQRLAQGQIPRPSSVAQGVAPELEAICMRALAPAPADRYATAADFRTALDDYLEAHPELRASSRELGRYVATMFEADRAKIHALIEAQVARAKADDAAVDDLMNLSEYFGNSGTRRTAEVPVADAPPASASKRWVFAVAASVLVLAGAVVVAYETRSAKRADAAAATAAARPTSELVVHVTPPDARVSLDGAWLSGSPPRGVFPLDGAQHRVYAEAAGYVARSDAVLLDSDRVSLDLSLDRAPAPSAAPVATVDPTSTAPVVHKAGLVGRTRRGAASSTPSGGGATAATEAVAVATTPPPATSAAQPAAPPHQWPTGPALDKSDPWASPAKP